MGRLDPGANNTQAHGGRPTNSQEGVSLQVSRQTKTRLKN